jgi:amidophosphoribosyltransferase
MVDLKTNQPFFLILLKKWVKYYLKSECREISKTSFQPPFSQNITDRDRLESEKTDYLCRSFQRKFRLPPNMSDQIKHECGLAFIRLLKPLEFYHEKYGTATYGIDKMRLLMQKMRNRGQDGAGFATVRLNPSPGERYISRKRSTHTEYLRDLFDQVNLHFKDLTTEQRNDVAWLRKNKPYLGEVLMGHLRYGTHGGNSLETVHPFHRQNNFITRNLLLAGNFNMTNVEELFNHLVELGQFPKEKSDTVTVLEKIGHFLDDEIDRLFHYNKTDGLTNQEINQVIYEKLDIQRLLQRACKNIDGGYVFAGMIGHGDAFVVRDPNGIRPAFWYQNDEVVVMASERPAIQMVFDTNFKEINEIKPGHALVVKYDGRISEVQFQEPKAKLSCSFERIYFSRGTDREIYQERKKLGESLARPILESVNFEWGKTVFSYIPNTAEAAFYGLMAGVQNELNAWKLAEIQKLGTDISPKKLAEILEITPRFEKVAHKDEKIRTFITNDNARQDLVSMVYDVTWGIVENDVDTLVLLDDSIVRGTTLRDRVLAILARLRPKKIIIVSSAPQIRYPDCYGIDMSKMKDFVAFNALVELLKEAGKSHLLNETADRIRATLDLPTTELKNEVIPLYKHFTYAQISRKIAEIVTPKDIIPEVEVIYQTIENLHKACPEHLGDWYFSGNYPTPGGNRVVNRAFLNFVENKDARAY